MTGEMSLEGQTALVTGASSGIGYATALRFARAGARVIANHYDDKDGAASLTREIEAAGGRVTTISGDVSKQEAVDALFSHGVEVFDTIDILVNNAGIQKDAEIVDMELADWQRVIEVNLTGQFLCARAAVREFMRRGVRPEISLARGKIICMSSIHQMIPWAGHANYAASKGGIMQLMESLAQEVARHKIRVNAVAPGAIRTAINEDVWSDPKSRRDLLKVIPYGRLGEPEDVARAVHWLASDCSDYVTGTTLVVGGGMKLYPGLIDNG